MRILKSADYVASTTAFDAATERAMLREAARSTGRGIYSVGALLARQTFKWTGGSDRAVDHDAQARTASCPSPVRASTWRTRTQSRDRIGRTVPRVRKNIASIFPVT